MAAYDSDTSSEGGNEYTTTNVTLGYAAVESTGDDISRIGGQPAWLEDNTRPPATLAKCQVCNGYMSLLLQLNADLQQHFPQDQRRLHVWCCRKKACSKKPGSIRSFREVKKGQTTRRARSLELAKVKDNPKQDLGSALFRGALSSTSSNSNPFSAGTSNANPFSANAASTTSASPFGSLSSLAAKLPQNPAPDPQPPSESFADKLRISSDTPSAQPTPSEPWPKASAFPPPFSSFYLDAYPEELEPPPSQAPESSSGPSKSQYDVEDASSSALDKDSFESSLDKTFQKFSDTIAQNPEQVLRYEFKGQPLLYSGTDSVSSRFIVPHGKSGAVRGMPRCESCGAQRVFEMQLVPGLIYELEKGETMDLDDGMEWGTIIIGSCANNCGEEGKVAFREEWTGVQWEERVARK